jgi:CelD/BcsL family acetyltransferase involved in cellulose biosynthesis
MIAGFRAAGGVFFTELLLDGQVIASTCNLISGNSAFAFKLGWDPAYAKYAPGLLNELFLLQNVQAKFSHLDFFDSGAVEGSFIDALWCDKRVLVSGVFATSLIGKLIFTSAALRRHLRRFGSTVHSATHHAIQTAWLRIA